MKKILFLICALIFGLLVATGCDQNSVVKIIPFNDSTLVRIMPLGDSITDGKIQSSDKSGYRRCLYTKLVEAGYQIDFVGSCHTGATDFDTDHEGHPGYTDQQIAENIIGWLEKNPTDVILLHIGTNCFDTNPKDVENILNCIDEYEKNHHCQILVFVARIIDRKNITEKEEVEKFNDNIQKMVEERIEKGDFLVMVDMESALIYPEDMSDNLHPNDNGYQKMAETWFKEIDNLVKQIKGKN